MRSLRQSGRNWGIPSSERISDMRYLLDTVALVRHFTSSGRIGKKAARLLDTLEHDDNEFVISVVSLMEVMYLAEKTGLRSTCQKH